ncbi:hypothetical protein, partial [Rhodococcus sp. HNM0569]|uniref:hypothetical protein n=1 Tax=Rhodococcus sp. HNM0569 TaxID=2716340 RepID=UPI00197D7D47
MPNSDRWWRGVEDVFQVVFDASSVGLSEEALECGGFGEFDTESLRDVGVRNTAVVCRVVWGAEFACGFGDHVFAGGHG